MRTREQMEASLQALPALVNTDEALVRRGCTLRGSFLVQIDEAGWLVEVDKGRIGSVTRAGNTPNCLFSLRADAATWAGFWEPEPRPGHQDIFPLVKLRKIRIAGDTRLFAAYLLYVKGVLAAPRRHRGAA